MEGGPLKLYVHKTLIAPGMTYSEILVPFLGVAVKKDSQAYVAKTSTHFSFDAQYFTLVEKPEEAEYILMPHDYWRLKDFRPDLLDKIIAEATQCRKPLLIEATGDRAGAIEVPNSRVLRINQYRFELPAHEITTPVPCEDLLEGYAGNTLVLRPKKDVPSVGFVGWASMPLKQRIRSLIKELPVRLRGLFDAKYNAKIKGVFWRERAVAIFKKSKRVENNFIIRSAYLGTTRSDTAGKDQSRVEFVNNILESDYSLVIRGDPNASTRLYEVLSLGRIPVIIDTACVFPLEHLINYRDFCVIIDYKDLKQAPDILADFHERLTSEQFIDMQKKARHAFETFLRYDRFTKYLVEMLRAPSVR